VVVVGAGVLVAVGAWPRSPFEEDVVPPPPHALTMVARTTAPATTIAHGTPDEVSRSKRFTIRGSRQREALARGEGPVKQISDARAHATRHPVDAIV